jgi:hypothetical protein
MAKVQISGSVSYNDMSPAPNAAVEIWELDLAPGGNNDRILTRTTDNDGRFSGLSSEWKDAEGVVLGIHVLDVLNLEFRVKVDNKTHSGPFFMGHGTSLPIVLPFPPPKPVSKAERDLVQVVFLSDGLIGGERALYQFIEASSESVVALGLGPLYRHIHVLKGNDATLAAFKSTLQIAASASGVAAVDVIFNTHGLTDHVVFKDGAKSSAIVKVDLNGLSASTRAKFRAVFSTACFGATHRSMWKDIGFSVADGSAGIYADSALSFPPMVGKWAAEGTFAEAVQLANTVGDPADNLAKAYYNTIGQPNDAAQVDSTRTIAGNGLVRIYSLP